MGFVDLHSHILPGLDDGSPDDATSLEMIAGLADLGFDTLCATPHQKEGQYLPALADISDAFTRTAERVGERGISVQLLLAAENMWDSVFFERMSRGEIPYYGPGPTYDHAAMSGEGDGAGRPFLVEFRVHQLPTGLLTHIFQLRLRGHLPVIAHPERYQPLWKTPETVAQLAEQCAMVVDLGAVAGCHGRKQASVARKMLKKGLAHAVASDAHAPADVRIAAEGMAWIRKKMGEDALTRLLDTAPRRILSGRHPAS